MKKVIQNVGSFFTDIGMYSRNVLVVHLLMFFLFIPGVTQLVRWSLARGNVYYISSDNFLKIFLQHPWVGLALIISALLLIALVFFEFTFLLLSVFYLRKKARVSLLQLLKETAEEIIRIRGSEVLFFILYFFLILPFGGLGYQSELLAKIKIPVFILDYIFEYRLIFVPLLFLFYAVAFYFGYRLIFTLPIMILKNVSLKEAVAQSYQITRQYFKKIAANFLSLVLVLAILSTAVYGVPYLIQTYVDATYPHEARIIAVFGLTFITIASYLMLILSTITLFYVLILVLDEAGIIPEIPAHLQIKPPHVRKSFFKVIEIFILIIAAGIGTTGVVLYTYMYLEGALISQPLILSHRGVDNQNGAQNTLPALEKTAQLQSKPDYIEMDVQETKDKKFVVMHDANLKALSGVDKAVGQLTLSQLEKLSVHENGFSAKIPSFDAYLAVAQKYHQKLLIEIKISPHDSSDLVLLFLKRYQDVILEQNYQIHSLSYDVVKQLKEKAPQIQVGYILPFNLVGPPVSKADFFTMEYSTLNADFVESAHAQGKKVYAWTVNDEAALNRVMFYGVDGVISDDVTLVRKEAKDEIDTPSYAIKMLNYYAILDKKS